MMTEEKIENDSFDIQKEAVALTELIAILQDLSPDSRGRLMQTILTFFNVQPSMENKQQSSKEEYPNSGGSPKFSEDRSMTPKEFLLEKQPKTDVERVACLAYYLTHYRDTPHFKTIDISKLNTEAAQRKFANAAKAVGNAARNEYLVSSTKGNKQLGVCGELFVDALPDRESAKNAVNSFRPKRKRTNRKSAVKS